VEHRVIEMETDEEYIGDAVYVKWTGGMMRLRTGDGNNQVIYLEPVVYHALVSFFNRTSTPKPTGD
jgi:hypothetical protein